MFIEEANIQIKSLKIKAIVNDAEKSASAVHLEYVSDSQPGISRIRTKAGFLYLSGKKRVTDKATLERIKKLVIPPAWENVWICASETGHLQATGTDLKNRKQYKYHSLWSNLRNHTKFYRLYQFGKAIPSIRKKLHKHLSLPGLPLEKVLAAVVCIMEKTSIRIGSSMYEKLYGSFGITTLKDKHVKINKEQMQFLFKGKKGVRQTLSLKSKRLSRIVKSCRDIPGKELFQYYDENGRHRSIDSGMVNNYLKQISGDYFTAKDFRTWSGSVHALMAIREMEEHYSPAEARRNIVVVLDKVAAHLGNTRSVCKKYYVHPLIISLYENNELQKYLYESQKKPDFKRFDLEHDENILMKLLHTEISA